MDYLDYIDILEKEGWGLVPKSVPTGGDDYDVEWTVVSYHMAEPKERVVGRGSTPREAIQDAAPF